MGVSDCEPGMELSLPPTFVKRHPGEILEACAWRCKYRKDPEGGGGLRGCPPFAAHGFLIAHSITWEELAP